MAPGGEERGKGRQLKLAAHEWPCDLIIVTSLVLIFFFSIDSVPKVVLENSQNFYTSHNIKN